MCPFRLIDAIIRFGRIADKSHRLLDLHRVGLERFYNAHETLVHQPLDEDPPPNTVPLHTHAQTYNFALLDGRRLTPTSRATRGSAGSSIVQVKIGANVHAGELREIFVHRQPGIAGSSNTPLVAIEWMKNCDFTPLDNAELWNRYLELGIDTWDLDVFLDPQTTNPPMIMRLADIHCQLARGRLTHTTPHMWITTTMDRVCTAQLLFPIAAHLRYCSSQHHLQRSD
ncbi:hypothetical protein C8J57DRAFT_1104501 [Mycena rebaudengoi]|nr:hypothetical protein C8J57DRAFT_1104501 [Mycena rebaudengoi]